MANVFNAFCYFTLLKTLFAIKSTLSVFIQVHKSFFFVIYLKFILLFFVNIHWWEVCKSYFQIFTMTNESIN